MKREISIDRREHSFSVLGRVDEMRRDEQFCDFIIKVGSEEICSHRNILAGGSDYFRAMFSRDTKERKSGVVEMLDVDPECTVICVDHIYGGKVHVPDGKYEEMVHVAVLMQLNTLRDAIASLLEENLEPKLFFVARKIASMYECKKLDEKCKKFAEENFLAISKEQEFGELEKNFMKKMISSKNVKISENEKLDVLLRWIKFDSERTGYLMELVKCVDLSNVSAEYRRYLIEENSLIHNNHECVLHFSISMMDTMGVKPKSLPSRENTSENSALILFDKNSGHLQRFLPKDNSWTEIHAMNEKMKKNYFSTVSIDDHVYVLTELQSVYRLDYTDETATWERMADMLADHGGCPPAVVLLGHIYVIGGYGYGFGFGGYYCRTQAIERYDPDTNLWNALVDRCQPSRGLEILAFDRCIYSFGGFINCRLSNRVERFDPTTFTWTELPPMKEVKGYVSAVELNEKIYVIGGHEQHRAILATVECYDTKRNNWTTLRSMNFPRTKLRGFALGGVVYAVGGVKSSDSIEMYDIKKNVWSTIKLPSCMNLQIKGCVKAKIS